jgi:protocatechuate 3,4-dioxygenase beta subunit
MKKAGVMYRIVSLWCVVVVCVTLGCVTFPGMVSAAPSTCAPTRADDLGPFYEPNAPERDKTGQGLVISGTVRSARDCSSLSGAVIEWWAANAHGDYDNAHRATQRASADGSYQYTTDFPGTYPGRPPHVHVRVTAPGHRTLVTQVYPQQTQTALSLDLVLAPQ